MSQINQHQESEPLLPQSTVNKSKGSTTLNGVRTYFDEAITTRWADLILLVAFFVAGLIDSGAYNAYECFVSMQTGNTVFAALGVSDLPVSQPKHAWTKSVTAIVCFLLGSLSIGALHNHFGQRKRWVLASSFTLQLIMTAIAAALVGLGKSSGSPVSGPPAAQTLPKDPGFPWIDLIPIGLLSFQASGKVVASRALQYGALPTVVLTTLYSDLMSDPGLFTAGIMSNPQRNRRIGGFVFYFGGAVSGGVVAKSRIGFAGALWIACAIKSLVVITFLLWEADSEEDEQD